MRELSLIEQNVNDMITRLIEENNKLHLENQTLRSSIEKWIADHVMTIRGDTYRRRALALRVQAQSFRRIWRMAHAISNRLITELTEAQAENAKLRTFLAEDEKWITDLKAALVKTAFERDTAK